MAPAYVAYKAETNFVDVVPQDQMPEKRQLSPSEQEKIRSHHMGWMPGSQSAKRYNKRFIERKAREAAQRQHTNLTATRTARPSQG